MRSHRSGLKAHARLLTVAAAQTLSILLLAPYAHATAAPRVPNDIDGDGKTDFTVWRPSEGTFYWLSSYYGGGYWAGWGALGDIPISGDFDGDGITDWVVYRLGTWYVWQSSTDTSYSASWGDIGDVPIPGDYDGDGKTDFAVYRPWNETWYVYLSGSNTSTQNTIGGLGAVPILIDIDGDGKTDQCVRLPTGLTWITPSTTGSTYTRSWGTAGDIPTPGDYDGDGKTDVAYWRPSNGTWYVTPSTNTSTTWTTAWGLNGDVPVPGDYDGDGTTDEAVWRPSDGNWYVISSSTGWTSATQWGTGGSSLGGSGSDVPMPNLPWSRNFIIMPAVGQTMSNWCWAASQQMVAQYVGGSGEPAECQQVNDTLGRSDCCNASPPAACNSGGCFNLSRYHIVETDLWQTTCGGLTPTGNSALSFSQLSQQFAGNRPVAFAWSWTGGGGHEMDAVGAWTTTDGNQWVEINDPEPGPTDGTRTAMLYTDWVSGSGYVHQRDTYNIWRGQ